MKRSKMKKKLGGSGEKTLPTKQAYFGGAFKLKGQFQITQASPGHVSVFKPKEIIVCLNGRKDSPGGTLTPQRRQKFHADDVNQYLHD